MPNALAIGISYNLFWTLNPRKIKPFYEAHKIKRKMLDEQMWCMGAYIHNAVLTAVERNLAGKKAKTKYLEKPFMQEETENTDEIKKTDKAKEENMRKVKAVFQSLEIMKANFELSKGSTK